jgi:hypothetical protein
VHPTVIVVTDRLVVIIETLIDRKHVIISTRKKTTNHRNIRIKNRQKQKKPTKTSSITTQKDILIIALRNGSSNILLNTRKEITKIQKQKQIIYLKT